MLLGFEADSSLRGVELARKISGEYLGQEVEFSPIDSVLPVASQCFVSFSDQAGQNDLDIGVPPTRNTRAGASSYLMCVPSSHYLLEDGL